MSQPTEREIGGEKTPHKTVRLTPVMEWNQ